MSLLPECHRWSQVAILALDAALVGSDEEMRLQAGLGLSSSQMYGESDVVDAALSRSLAIAEVNGDLAYQAGLLNMQHMFHGRSGNFKVSSATLSAAGPSRSRPTTSQSKLSSTLHSADVFSSLATLMDRERNLRRSVQIMTVSPTGSIFLGYDPHYRSSLALGRTLWLLGYPTQAIHWTREAVRASEGKRDLRHFRFGFGLSRNDLSAGYRT